MFVQQDQRSWCKRELIWEHASPWGYASWSPMETVCLGAQSNPKANLPMERQLVCRVVGFNMKEQQRLVVWPSKELNCSASDWLQHKEKSPCMKLQCKLGHQVADVSCWTTVVTLNSSQLCMVKWASSFPRGTSWPRNCITVQVKPRNVHMLGNVLHEHDGCTYKHRNLLDIHMYMYTYVQMQSDHTLRLVVSLNILAII